MCNLILFRCSKVKVTFKILSEFIDYPVLLFKSIVINLKYVHVILLCMRKSEIKINALYARCVCTEFDERKTILGAEKIYINTLH